MIRPILTCVLLIASFAAHAQKDPMMDSERSIIRGALPGTTCSAAGGTNCTAAFTDPAASHTPGPAIVSTFDVAGCDQIDDIAVGLDISHTWMGDVVVSVTDPNANEVLIVARPGSAAPLGTAAFGCSADDMFNTIADGGAESVENGCPWTVGATLDPTDSGEPVTVSLDSLIGNSGNGTWTLTATDWGVGDTGSVNDWSLDLTCTTLGPPPAPEIIPTLGTWGLIALFGLLGLIGLIAVRRS